MQRQRFFYLLQVQYLGFRYHGWQKQPDVKTVEGMLSRTIAYVLERKNFKLLASGRTDAMVSAQHSLVELFLEDQPLPDDFFDLLNVNLPPDIRVIRLEEVDEDFNVIAAPVSKEYLYLFCFGRKMHPFAAPFMTNVMGELDLPLMQEAARLFVGEHDFINYTYKPRENTRTVGVIDSCEILPNTFYTASFLEGPGYALRIKGKGFKRHQVRLIMGALFDLGQGRYDLELIARTLEPGVRMHLDRIAPASGLILHKVDH